MAGFMISEMKEEDGFAVISLINGHFPLVRMDEEKMAGRLAKGSRFFVAKSGGDAIGFVELQVNGFIRGIAVSEGWRGKGVGTALLEKAISEANKRGFVNVRLRVKIDNLPAIRVYQRYGFAVKRETINRKGDRLYLMEKGVESG